MSCDATGSLVADFSSKGGPKDLKGTLEESGIRWQDGNLWELVSAKASKQITQSKCKV